MGSAKSTRAAAKVPTEGPARRRDMDTVKTSVNLQRTPAGSITVWVEAPDGSAGGIELESLDQRNPNARAVVAWAPPPRKRRPVREWA